MRILILLVPFGLPPLAAVLAVAAQPPAAREEPAILYSPADTISACAAYAKAQLETRRKYLRFLSAYEADAKELVSIVRQCNMVVNSLSRDNVPHAIVPVPNGNGRLWAVSCDDYKIPVTAWDRLIAEGSGRTPVPQPYFNQQLVANEYEEWGYNDAAGAWHTTEKRKTGKKTYKMALASWLPTADAVELARAVESNTPIARWDWFLYYALQEPAYHRFLGLDDKFSTLAKLADADETTIDLLGQESKGVVKKSEVANNVRGLRRLPTRLRRGRGYFWISDDYASSVGQDDLLASAEQLIKAKPGAHEIIWSLPNGLQGYLVTDGAGKRLDRAGIEFARDVRNGFASVEVGVRNCLCCHNVGIIPIRDEVRLVTKKKLALQVQQIREEDARLAQQIADRFFASDLDSEVKSDRETYAAAVKAITGGTPAAIGLELRKTMLAYEADVDLARLAREVGVDAKTLKGVLERSKEANLDQSVLVTVTGEKGRRDQIEVGFGQLIQLIAATPKEK